MSEPFPVASEETEDMAVGDGGFFACNRCERVFTSKIELAKHLRGHMREFQCTLCSEAFNTQSSLDKHIKLTHKWQLKAGGSRGRGRPKGSKNKSKSEPENEPEVDQTLAGLSSEDEAHDNEAPAIPEGVEANDDVPLTPRSSHRYGTRRIAVDYAKLTGSKRKTTSADADADDEYVPPRQLTPKDPSDPPRKRGRPPKNKPNIDAVTSEIQDSESVGDSNAAGEHTAEEPPITSPSDAPKIPAKHVVNNKPNKAVAMVTDPEEAVNTVYQLLEAAEAAEDAEVQDLEEEIGLRKVLNKPTAEDEMDDDNEFTNDDAKKYDGKLVLPTMYPPEEMNLEGVQLNYLETSADEHMKLCEKADDKFKVFMCSYCSNVYSQIQNVYKHVVMVHEKEVSCPACSKPLPDLASFSTHYCRGLVGLVPRNKSCMYSCFDCGKLFSRLDSLDAHIAGHRLNFHCKACNRTFMRKTSYERHACVMKPVKQDLCSCEICGAVFTCDKYLYRHMAVHTAEFCCKNCKKSFARKETLLQHVKKCCPSMLNDLVKNAYPCPDCHKVFSNAHSLKNHVIVHEGKFTCAKCKKTFVSQLNLDDHICAMDIGQIETSEDGREIYSCKMCDKRFTMYNNLKRHVRFHMGKFKCSECDKCFTRRSDMIDHVIRCKAKISIAETGSVKCEHCDNIFTDFKEFQRHFVTHQVPFRCSKCKRTYQTMNALEFHESSCTIICNDDLICEICEKRFRDPKYLARHIATHGEPKFECEHCEKKFARADYFNYHTCFRPDGSVVRVKRSRSMGVTVDAGHICQYCGKTFVSTGNLNKHLKRHGERKFECPTCFKRFHLESALKVHMKYTHTNKKDAQCPHCGKMLKSKGTLASHIRLYHSNIIVLYECPTCGKQFRQKGNMLKHTLMHSSDKKYSCTYCDKKFRYPEQYHKHKTEHEIGRQFVCGDCNKQFVKEYELRKHIQVFHSGLTYTCDFCPTDCRHYHTMRRHILKRHPEQSHVVLDPNYIHSLQRSTKPRSSVYDEEITQVLKNSSIIPVTTTAAGSTQTVTKEGGEETVIEFMSQEAAEVLQSLSAVSGDGQVQNIIFTDLSQAGRAINHTIVQSETNANEYILVPLVNQDGQEIEVEQIVEQGSVEVQVSSS